MHRYSIVAVVAIGLIPASNLASASAPLSAAIKVLHNPYLIVIIAVGGDHSHCRCSLNGNTGNQQGLNC